MGNSPERLFGFLRRARKPWMFNFCVVQNRREEIFL